MIGYGNNEHSQLEFEGSGVDSLPLEGGYRQAWAGGNFSIAKVSFESYNENGDSDLDPGLYCTGSSFMGQCDYPDNLFDLLESGRFTKIDLGLNHGIAVHNSSYITTPTFFMQNPLEPQNFHSQNTDYYYKNYHFATEFYQWGDNFYQQTTTPSILDTNFIFMIAAGGNHNVALIGDTTLIADSITVINEGLVDTVFVMPNNAKIISWGDNSFNQCDVPDRFNPVSDSLFIVDIDAGLNHTVVTYDSSGIRKLAAWGDNSYGQLNIPEPEFFNTNPRLLDVKCGYNHNLAILYDDHIDYSDALYNEEIIDTLFTTINKVDNEGNYVGSTFTPLSFHIWGDNTYGQHAIPYMQGFLEQLDVGGYHNTIVNAEDWVFGTIFTGYESYYGLVSITLPFSSGRDIVSWGKNDFGQCEFPIEYYVDFVSEWWSDGPGTPQRVANSEPVVVSGANHTLVKGERIYRSPSMDYNNLDQFNGALGDTVYQTLTLRNIGPDTLHLDTLFLNSTNPFYLEYPDEEYILYGDSVSFQIYSIFNSSHALNESAILTINTRGWFLEDVEISLSSFFGPDVELSGNWVVSFFGNYDETQIRSVTITNTGNATVFIDDMEIRDGGNFEIEPIGDENSIEPGDSLNIYISTNLYDLPRSYGDYLDIYITNFNTVRFDKNLNARRYLKVGDNVSDPAYDASSSWLRFCGVDATINDGWGGYYLQQFDYLRSKIHYLDFGFSQSALDEDYLSSLNTIHNDFKDNSNFFSIVTLESDSFDFEPWSDYGENCDPFHSEYFPSDANVGLSIIEVYNNYYFGDQFSPDVQSVVFNEFSEITYLGDFNLEEVTNAIETAIDNCDFGCLPDNAINMIEDTINVVSLPGATSLDTIVVENNSEFSLDYFIEGRSGTAEAHSLYFNGNTSFTAPRFNSDLQLSPPLTISFWFKPTTTNFGDADEPTTFIEPSPNHPDYNMDDYWKIILRNDQGNYPRIGWQDEESSFMANTPIFETFYFITFVVSQDEPHLKIYVNGNLEVDETLLNQMPSLNQMVINFEDPDDFYGYLSQTSIWSIQLDNEQVLEMFAIGPDADLNNFAISNNLNDQLFSYWTMDDGGGNNDVFDYSGNGHDAWVCCGNNKTIEIVQTGTPWLSMFGGENGTLAAGETRSLLFNLNAEELIVGNYVGEIILYPEHNEYIFQSTTINLEVTENLSNIDDIIPTNYELHQNYPNPFNPITNIQYDLPAAINVKIDIYDIRGRKVKSLLNQIQEPGFKSIQWNALSDLGERVGSGMYFYRIETSDFNKTKKMILLK